MVDIVFSVFGRIGVAIGLMTTAAPRDIREDFERPAVISQSGDITFGLFVFWRDRNPNGGLVQFVRDAVTGARAVRLSVAPGLYPNAKSGGPLENDRAELREAGGVQLRYGTTARYRFALRIPEDFPRVNERMVLAQIKTPAARPDDPSPAFALRFEGGVLFVTLEYERALLRETDQPVPRVGDACPAGTSPAYLHRDEQVRVALVPDITALPAHRMAQFSHCSQAIVVQQHRTMPQIVGRWMSVDVLIKPDPGGNGRFELAINGDRIATATGRIGLGRGLGDGVQFFKIGPYRNRAAFAAAIEIDDLSRTVVSEVASEE